MEVRQDILPCGETLHEMKMLKVRCGIKKALDILKTHRRETYDDVITKLVIEHGLNENDLPTELLEQLDYRINEVRRGEVYSVDEAKKRVFGNEDAK